MSSQIRQTETGFEGFIETECKIELDGREFSAGGAFLAKRVDNGKFGGILYAYETTIPGQTQARDAVIDKKIVSVGTWDGSQKVKCMTGQEYRSNFGDMRQSVWFRWEGRFFWGTWYKTNSDIVRCIEITEKSYNN